MLYERFLCLNACPASFKFDTMASLVQRSAVASWLCFKSVASPALPQALSAGAGAAAGSDSDDLSDHLALEGSADEGVSSDSGHSALDDALFHGPAGHEGGPEEEVAPPPLAPIRTRAAPGERELPFGPRSLSEVYDRGIWSGYGANCNGHHNDHDDRVCKRNMRFCGGLDCRLPSSVHFRGDKATAIHRSDCGHWLM